MAITLLMMAAVVNIFASIGQSVRQRRAGIEMANMVRTARNLLEADLAGHTCSLLPWTRPESAMGYFEIVEGRYSDINPSPLTLDSNPANWGLNGESLIPISAQRSGDGYATVTGQTTATNPRLSGLGDFDDILAFTTRRFDRPFKGRFGNLGTVESPVAEVIWFAVENPVSDVPGAPEAGLRTIYRRTLLIAPWLKEELAVLQSQYNNSEPPTAREFFQLYDISARLENGVWIPNTLADLTRRENRFGRWPGTSGLIAGSSAVAPVFTQGLTNATRIEGFPFEIDTAKIRALGPPDPTDNTVDWTSTLRPLEGVRAGEDIVLANVLAFDVRVYDPLASVVADFNDDPDIALTPVDPGWSRLVAAPPAGSNVQPVSQGAYVDLSYGVSTGDVDSNWLSTRTAREQWNRTVAPGNPASMFSWEMHPKSGLLARGYPASPRRTLLAAMGGVYDTWSLHYEYDGLDQDRANAVHLSQNGLDSWRDPAEQIDEGSDGVDNPEYVVSALGGQNSEQYGGVDEASERETSPPYPYPLRAIEIRMRAFEPDSGGIREVSVQKSFAPQ